jgi:hypothetical protein
VKVGDLVKYRTRKNAGLRDEEWGEYIGVVTKIRYPCEEEERLNDHQTHAVLWSDVPIIYWESPSELELINEEN